MPAVPFQPERALPARCAPEVTVPVVEFAEVFHVGTLELTDRGRFSFEGDGLSVSVHPDEWATIACLPGRVWQAARADGAPLRFADWHAVAAADRDRLRAWAAAAGWIVARDVFRVSYFDDELDDTVWFDVDSLEAADAEADGREAKVTQVRAWRPTPTFPAARIHSADDPSDVLLAVFVTACRPDLDGVWWDDTFAPELLSCPRGVLVRPLDLYRFVPA